MMSLIACQRILTLNCRDCQRSSCSAVDPRVVKQREFEQLRGILQQQGRPEGGIGFDGPSRGVGSHDERYRQVAQAEHGEHASHVTAWGVGGDDDGNAEVAYYCVEGVQGGPVLDQRAAVVPAQRPP